MGRTYRPRLAVVAATCAAALLAGIERGNAQTALPEIVVEAPSPVRAPDITESVGAYGTLVVVDDAFVPVTVVPEREVLATPGANIADAIDQKPGITSSTFAGGASRPIIRGLDNARVRVQENGISAQDVSTVSEDHAVPIDPFAADQIEVIRGPATLRYGSGAIGGVVAIENGRIPTAVPLHGVSGEVTGALTSVDDGREGAFSTTAGADGIAVHVDGFKRDSGDYDTPKGTQLNSAVEAEGLSGGASYIWQNGYVGLSYSNYSSLYGIPGAEEAEEHARIDLKQDKFQSQGEFRIGSYGIEALRFWYGQSNYAHNELDAGEEGDVVGSRFTNKEKEARVEVQHMPAQLALGELRGAVGVQWDDRDTTGLSFEGDSLLDPANRESLAGYVFEELQVSPTTTFQAAARIEHVDVSGANRLDALNPDAEVTQIQRDFTPTSVSFGMLQKLPLDMVLSLNAQYAERAPEAQELFSKGAHDATGTFEIGNPNLDPEVAKTAEIGLRRKTGALRFDASAYYTQFDGFIFKQLTGVTCGATLASCGEEDEGDQVLFSQRDATFYGAELAVQYDVGPIWRGIWGVEGQYDFVRAQFSDDENVPRIPPHRLGGGLYYRDANWFGRVGLLHAFDQDEIGVNEIDTPGYNLVSAELSYTAKLPETSSLGSEYTIGIKGENLADDDVLNHASFKRREDVELPGANVKAFAKFKFN